MEKEEENLTLPHESLSATERSDMENEKKKKKTKKDLTLPHELIIEILLRLPARSLLRFRIVCTSWLFFISDPQFAKSHFDLNASPTHRLLLRFINEDQVESFDLESSLDDRSNILTLNAPPPSMYSNHENPLYFKGSCRGFMLVVYAHTGDVIVWNPTTKFHQRFPDLDYKKMLSPRYLCGFGYDSSTDDYFVVVITLFGFRTKIYPFSMKTESWCDTIKYNYVHYKGNSDSWTGSSEPGVCLNGSLHWLITCKDTNLPVFIHFDLREKSLSDIPLSSELAAELMSKGYSLRALGGCLGVCHEGGGGLRMSANIWVMKEYKVQSSWTKVFVMTFWDDIPCSPFYPICFIEGGGVVGSSGNGRLMKFNAMGKLLEHLKYDRGYYYYNYKQVVQYFGMYRESLLFFPRRENNN